MSYAVKVENVTKKYKIYTNGAKKAAMMNPFSKKKADEFVALSDVSFEIARGEIVGIIGNNGAGKSTMLKILSGVAFQNGGTVDVKGRISSLIELGAGFNPELTGISNIYFNGSIMGMSKSEVDKVKDKIIDFAELGDFINQPVKNYSSGMYARLAFAVAINIDPDILIVDEILSVGDVGFQQKCMAKFDEFKKQGRTIIYVSHGLSTIQTYCERAIWLEKGKVRDIGPAFDIVEDYYRSMMDKGEEVEESKAFVELTDVKIENDITEVSYGEGVNFNIEYNVFREDIKSPGISVELRKAYREPCEFRHVDQFICAVNSNVDEFSIPWKEGKNKVQFSFDDLRVTDGLYYIDVIFSESQDLVPLNSNEGVISFKVNSDKKSQGFVFLKDNWEE